MPFYELKRLSQEKRQQLARSSLQYFARYMGYVDTAWFQDEWYNLLQPANDPAHFSPLPWHTKALKQFHLEAPRKHAKSECVSINYPSWLIGNYPEIRIGIVSKTAPLAEQTVAAIRNRIENDPRFISVFGDLKPKNPQKWTDSEFFVNRKVISKFATLYGCGLGGSLTGRGFDVIIADDIIDEENVNTPNQLEKASRWFFKLLLTTLFSHGATLVIGTRWHYADLYNDLISPPEKGGKGWPYRIYRAIQNYENVEKGEAPRVLWPEVWPYERLMQKKADIGTVYFNSQYQNDPTSMTGDLLKAEWLHPWNETENNFVPSPNLPKYAGIDPALGEGDLFAISTASYDRILNRAYLYDVYAKLLPYPAAMQLILQLHGIHNYSKIYVESNAFQKVIMYMPQLQGLPIVPTVTSKGKEERLIPLSSHFESKRMTLNPAWMYSQSGFFQQWVQFPRSAHDDALDCVEVMARNLLGVTSMPEGKGVAVVKKKPTSNEDD